MKHRTRLMTTSTLCFSTILLVASLATTSVYAFDPDEGAAPVAEVSSSNLPSTKPLTDSRTSRTNFPQILSTPQPPIKFTPLKPATPIAAVPVAAVPATSFEVAPPAAVIAPATPMKRIVFPPVDPVVKARAEQINVAPIAATPPTVVPVTPVPSTVAQAPAATSPNFIAPLPLVSPIATPTSVTQPEPLVVAAPVSPVAVTPVPASVGGEAPAPQPAPVIPAPVVPKEELSRDSKTILSRIPSKLDTAKPGKPGKIGLNRNSPSVTPLEVKGGKVDAYEAAGIKISVRRPGLDTNYELNRAFNALSSGDSNTAIEIYKSILSTEPTNADALFGLASIYHRQGQLDKARPLYGTLLQNYPNHREGINNFLVLVSDEAPQEALAELERLEQRNPDFSPIPAQEAVVLSKLGYAAEARNKMLRAIEISPDNLTYKYNLAIMLDRQGDYASAAEIYRLLIDAANKGAVIPAPIEALQKRLTYISTVNNSTRMGVNVN